MEDAAPLAIHPEGHRGDPERRSRPGRNKVWPRNEDRRRTFAAHGFVAAGFDVSNDLRIANDDEARQLVGLISRCISQGSASVSPRVTVAETIRDTQRCSGDQTPAPPSS